MNAKDAQPGDRVRMMDPTPVANGFVDCRTVLTVTRPGRAYWLDRSGRQVFVGLVGDVDKVEG